MTNLIPFALLAGLALPGSALQAPLQEAQQAPALSDQPLAGTRFGGVLLTPSAVTPSAALERPYVTRAASVDVSASVLASLARGDHAAGARFELELPGGRRVVLKPETLRATRTDSFVASGGLAGDRLGHFTLASERGVLAASVRTGDGRVFSLRCLANGQHWWAELDTSAMPGCGVDVPGVDPQMEPGFVRGGDDETEEPPLELLGGNERFDVLVIYTPAVRALAGGTLQVRGAIEVAVQEGDDAFSRSDVSADLRLVGVMEVDYDESGATLDSHLSRLTDPADGSIDAIHQWRNACGADLVAMLVDDSDGGELCGLAWVKPGGAGFGSVAGPYSITDYDCLGGLTLIHELGHNYGCAHDWSESSTPSFGYAKGYCFTGSTGDWRTLMCKNNQPGTRILQYSNPDVSFDGAATGVAAGLFVAEPADNARAIDANSGDLEGLRSSVTKLASVFVDFDTTSILQTGDLVFPFDLLEEGLLKVADGGRLTLRGNGPAHVPPIAQDVVLDADSGSVVLGL